MTQVPKLPVGGNKRRMPDNPTPDMLKKMKLDVVSLETPAENSNAEGPSQHRRVATVEDEEDVDMESGFAPGGDADYFVEEDDEGRFFGGGLTSEQKEILNIFENAGGEGVQEDVRVGLQTLVILMLY